MTKVAMIGVGKLGQACAEVMADTYPLVGYDVAPREPKNFPMVDSVKDAVEYADIIFPKSPSPTSFVRAMPADYKQDTSIDTFTAYKNYIRNKPWAASNYLRDPSRKPDWI